MLLVAHLQAHIAIEAIDALVVDGPSLPSEQDMDPQRAVTWSSLRDLSNSLPESNLLNVSALVMKGRPIDFDHPARPAVTDAIAVD